MIKFKHFYVIEGSNKGTAEDLLQEAEKFVNKEGIDPIEISHAFSTTPHRVLSIFITYVEVDMKQKKAIKDAAEAVSPKKKPVKKTKKKGKE